jgi:hypothetical protein
MEALFQEGIYTLNMNALIQAWGVRMHPTPKVGILKSNPLSSKQSKGSMT